MCLERKIIDQLVNDSHTRLKTSIYNMNYLSLKNIIIAKVVMVEGVTCLNMSLSLIKHKRSLPVKNCDEDCEKSRDGKKKHGDLFPESVRGMIVGSSGCGKTNLVYVLLTHPNGLRYENVYVYSKTLHQPKYQALEKIISSIKGMKYFAYNTSDEIPDTPRPNSVIIFDDVICEKQKKICEYFSTSRHYQCDCFYLGQTYSKIPKQLIRDNANFIILFPMDQLNLRHCYNEKVDASITWPLFKDMCAKCWEKPYGFLVIDKANGNYRNGFDQFFSFNTPK